MSPLNEKRKSRRRPGPKPGLPLIDIQAISILLKHPDWSNSQIAAKIGCHVKTLSRSNRFKACRAMLRRAIKYPAGSKSDGHLEAWEDEGGDVT